MSGEAHSIWLGIGKVNMSRYSEIERNVRPLESDLKKERVRMVFNKYRPSCRDTALLSEQVEKAMKNRQFDYVLLLGKWIVDEVENAIPESSQT